MRELLKDSGVQTLFDLFGDNIRLVGGCVRDYLLQKPIKDIDLATCLLPIDATKILEENDIKVIPTGIKYGTITALINGKSYEITTLRHDIECFGRDAKVSFTKDWQEDALRRDFTINAMSCDKNGKIYDYFSGREDLKNKIIRFIGSPKQRCREDYLRILRCFRFFAYLDGEIEEGSLQACAENASNMKDLSGERIQSEMFKILSHNNVFKALKLMQKYKVLKVLFEEDINLDVLEKSSDLQKKIKYPQNHLINLSSIILSIKEPKTLFNFIVVRWKLSNKDKDLLRILCFEELNNQSDKKNLRYFGKEKFIALNILQSAKNNNNEITGLIEFANNYEIPEFPVKGKDLLELGFKAGKDLGEILKQLENHWEENDYKLNREELINWMKDNK